MEQKYIRIEDQKPGALVGAYARMLLKGEDLNQKLMFSKYVFNRGGSVKKIM